VSIPKDGHYTAEVQYDTGGALPTYIHVHNGIIRSIVGNEIKPDACSDFHPVSTQQFCGVWPLEASIELEALRTANAGLVEKVGELQSWKDQWMKVESGWNPNELAVLLGGTLGESQRVVIQREVPKLVERVKRLEEAGSSMESLLESVNFMMPTQQISTATEDWRKAKGQP